MRPLYPKLSSSSSWEISTGNLEKGCVPQFNSNKEKGARFGGVGHGLSGNRKSGGEFPGWPSLTHSFFWVAAHLLYSSEACKGNLQSSQAACDHMGE